MTKSDKTKQYILETVGPIFNKNGYSRTSMSEITQATGLTKGAIYGNFENKDALALAAFNYNVSFIMDKIRAIMTEIESPLEKFYALTNFYRNYYKNNINFGGCPILNVGVDANFNNPELYQRVKYVAKKLKESISQIILQGISCGEINSNIDVKTYGGRIFSLIEGAVFTSVLMRDESYLLDMMDHLDEMIKIELHR